MEKLNLYGILTTTVTNHTTGEVTRHSSRNKLTDYFIARLIEGVTSSDPDDDFIIKIGVGDDDTEPTAADTGLSNEFIKNLNNLDTGTAGKIVADFVIQTGDANGLVIAEYGLYTNGENLVARNVKAPISKNDSISIQGTWEINFTS